MVAFKGIGFSILKYLCWFSFILYVALSLCCFLCYAEAFQLNKSPTCLFCFCWLCFWCHIHEIIAKPISWSFSSLCSWSFTVLGIVFKFLIYLNWLFCVVYSMDPISFFFMWIYYFPNIICSRDYPFPIVFFLAPLSKAIEHICVDSFLNSLLVQMPVLCSAILCWLL